MKRFFFLLAMVVCLAGVQAQIPPEVTEVMNKCRAAMGNPAGVEYEMDMKAGMGPVALKMHFVVASKGELYRSSMTTKVLGVAISTESGFDGTNTWTVDHGRGGDTITFTRGDNRTKSDGDLELDLDSQFRKAKMKLKDGYYEITFSDPKDKASEVKSVAVKISEKNYVMRELRSGARGAKVTMTITKIRIGLKDSYFKLDLTKHPDAVVVRK